MAARKRTLPTYPARSADPGVHEWFDGDATQRVVVGTDRKFQPTTEAHQIQAERLQLPRWRSSKPKGA